MGNAEIYQAAHARILKRDNFTASFTAQAPGQQEIDALVAELRDIATTEAAHGADECAAVIHRAADALLTLQTERDELAKKVYQPGVFKCAKCNFELVQKTLNGLDGTVSARDAVGEKCPNDGWPMWRVSYMEDNAQAWKMGEEQFDRATLAEAREKELEGALRPDDRYPYVFRDRTTWGRVGVSFATGTDYVRVDTLLEDKPGGRWIVAEMHPDEAEQMGLRLIERARTCRSALSAKGSVE